MSLISPAMMMISEKQSMNNTKITATNLALVFPQETLHLLLELITTSLSAVCMYYILMFIYVNNSSQYTFLYLFNDRWLIKKLC